MIDGTRSPSYRTYEQLQSMLHETAKWVINGRADFALGYGANLFEALEKAAKFAQSGATFTALSRLPNGSVVVFPAQIGRLRKIIVGLEVPSIKETEYWRQTGD
jgi:hypothetical protein